MKNVFKFKKIWNVLSILLVICSIASVFYLKIKWGSEFVGGTITSWKSPDLVQTSEISNLYFDKGVNIEEIVKTEDGLYLLYSEKLADEKVQELFDFIKQKYPKTEKLEVETVGRMVEKDVVLKVVISFGFLLIITVVFFFYSFGNLRKRYSPVIFSFCALTAITFDLVVIAGIMSLLGRYFEISFSSFFLVGSFVVIIFSIFSKYLVFNNIRKNLLEFKKEDVPSVLNRTLDENLSVILDIFLVFTLFLLPLIIFDGRNFQWLAGFLLSGIVISTYSELFVSNQLLLLFAKKTNVNRSRKKGKKKK